jgi:hypothetical protein
MKEGQGSGEVRRLTYRLGAGESRPGLCAIASRGLFWLPIDSAEGPDFAAQISWLWRAECEWADVAKVQLTLMVTISRFGDACVKQPE